MKYYMRKIYQELMENGVTFEKIQNREYRGNGIINSLESETDSWAYNVAELIDIRNWNLKNLSLKKPETFMRGGIPYESYVRKPKAYFELRTTQRGNLVLDWFPWNPNFRKLHLHNTDWIKWDDQWPEGGMHYPLNRVLMIHDFKNIRALKDGTPFKKLDYFILGAIKDLIDLIYLFLDRFIEIEKITDLYFDFKGEYSRRRLISFEIRNVKEAEAELHSKKSFAWILDTCAQLKTTPKKVLESFRANDMKYPTTARALTPPQKTLSPQKLKKLVHEIYSHPKIYDPILDCPPPGAEPRKSGAEIIKVNFEK